MKGVAATATENIASVVSLIARWVMQRSCLQQQ
jgi:hypothetical protein